MSQYNLETRELTPQVATPPTEPPESESREDSMKNVEQKLDEVIHQLKQLNRLGHHREFSLSRLVASISQMMVVALLFWAVVGVLDVDGLTASGAVTLKLLGAIALQMFSLTFFILDRQDR